MSKSIITQKWRDSHPLFDPIEPEDVTDAFWYAVIARYQPKTVPHDQEKDPNDE